MVMNPAAKAPESESLINPIERPGVTQELSENVILTTVDDLYNWARLSSLWPLLFGTACCFIEFAALIGSRFDFDRFGLVPRSS
ncbi:MAG TPA: NADH-quinone oxidoreductase subunit B, partial [Leptolyngbya sp.]|nr:NADH-quinone oxidoreductase subunit B [Leptolyngbya sp.]